MTAALKSAVDRQEPIVVTLWDPTWMFQKFDMKFLDDPKGVFPPPQCLQPDRAEGLLGGEPGGARAFSPASSSRSTRSPRSTRAVNDGQTMDQAIQAWIDANGELLERWENIKSY